MSFFSTGFQFLRNFILRQDDHRPMNMAVRDFLPRFAHLLLTRRGGKRQDLALFSQKARPDPIFPFSRPFLSAVIFSFFGAFTLNPGPVSASPPLIPPTHYRMDSPWGIGSPAFIAPTPQAAAAAATAYRNLLLGGVGTATLNGCSMTPEILAGSDYNHIYCETMDCFYYTTGTVCTAGKIFAQALCQYSAANWNGTQYYCPEAPEPGCDDSCN